jgi:hypothetical protein
MHRTTATIETAHDRAVSTYPDWLLDAVIDDLGRQNLRDYGNHETRWKAERSSAARAERRRRKTLALARP